MIGDDEERVVESPRLAVEHRILGPADEPGPGGGEGHGQADRDVLLLYKPVSLLIQMIQEKLLRPTTIPS